MKIKTYFITLICAIFIFLIILDSKAGADNKIMPLGDSITWDDRSNDQRSDGEKIAYRYRLWQLLTDAGYDFDFVGNQYTGFDIFPDAENEGHPGWTDDQIAASVYGFLEANPAEIILLHIGTNGLNPDPTGVKNILNEIDRYEFDYTTKITVILARIIDWVPPNATVTAFNDNVEDMAWLRVNDPNDPAYPDRIIFGPDVDMEDGAGIVYRLYTDPLGGDMWDFLHPTADGYSKMAGVWFSALEGILPQADAGPDQDVNEFDTVTLDASGSYGPKSGNFLYLWEQTDVTPQTPLVTLSDETAEKPTFIAPSVDSAGETLTFQLTVTDEDDLVSTDSVSIDVQILPQADAGPNQSVNEFDTVTLDASGSVGVGLSYQWTQTAGTPVVDLLPNAQAVQPTFAAPEVGASGEILTFELTVTDDIDTDATDTVNITVKTLPLADAGPDQSVTEGQKVTLDGSKSIGSDGMISYLWEQTTGTPLVTLSDKTAPKPTFTAPQVDSAGKTLTFKLTITDADIQTNSDTIIVTVNNNPIAPKADAGDNQIVTEGETVTLDGSKSSPWYDFLLLGTNGRNPW